MTLQNAKTEELKAKWERAARAGDLAELKTCPVFAKIQAELIRRKALSEIDLISLQTEIMRMGRAGDSSPDMEQPRRVA